MLRWGLLLLLLAMPAQADRVVGQTFLPAPSSCTPVGATQTFTSNIDGWTGYDGDGDCPVAWNSGSASIQRSRPGALGCNDTFGDARYDTPIGTRNGCVVAQFTGYDLGIAGVNGFYGPGIKFWDQTGASPLNHWMAYCNNPTCAQLRIANANDIVGEQIMCENFGAVAVNDYIVACFRETPQAAFPYFQWHVSAWNLTSAAPGNPTTLGAPTCQSNVTLIAGDATGTLAGVAMRNNQVGVGGFIRYDNVQPYSGCEDVGNDAGLNSWTAGNTWATQNYWE